MLSEEKALLASPAYRESLLDRSKRSNVFLSLT
jgi:hypothetical protein